MSTDGVTDGERVSETGSAEAAHRRRRPARGRWALIGLLAVAFVYAYPIQANGANQNAHYALVKALADGTPYVDRTLDEVGEVSTVDVSSFGGHVFAVKGPGLAFAALPAYGVIEAIGMRTVGDPARAIWALHLLGAALPVLLLVALAYMLAARFEPGFAAAAAAILGLGTLVLPFATLFFAHALSTLLGFAAFAVLWLERDGRSRLLLVFAGGLLIGLAVTTEYQLGVLGAILAVYALARQERLRRALAYAGGVALGVAPLLLFQAWAYGSPFHTPYHDYWEAQGYPGRDFHALPSLDKASTLLFSSMGVLTLMPVLVLGLVGATILYRRGRRAEALVIGGVALAYGVYFSQLGAFGGLGPPRYILTIVPFVALPLALAFRALPLTTLVLASVSTFQMLVMTTTGPLAAYDGDWLRRVGDREFVQTAASFVGVTGWYAIAPFLAAAIVALVAAAASSARPALSLREAPVALGALAGWALVTLAASNEYGRPPDDAYVLATVVLLGVALAVLAWLSSPGAGRGLRAARAGR